MACMQVIPEDSLVAPSDDAPALETVMLDVGGMKCAGCVRAVENQLKRQPGVVSATVNLVTAAALVDCEPGVVDLSALTQTLTDAGFPTQLRYADAASKCDALNPVEQQQREAHHRLRQLVIAAILLVCSAVGHLDHFGWMPIPGLSNIWLHWGLATLALMGPGRPIVVDGWRGLRYGMPNMNTLVGLGALTAYTASLVALLVPHLGWECFFDEPVMLLGFILLGRALEQQARSRAAQAFQALLALQPTVARLVRSDGVPVDAPPDPRASVGHSTSHSTIEIPADRVKVGEWLQVLPGEKFPVDGQIVVGQTTVDESMLTGEATPVAKGPADSVVAGSLNLSGAIVVQATRVGHDTALAQIIALVEIAQTRKAPIQRVADVVAGYFTYGVITIALLTFLFWYFIGIPFWAESLSLHSLGSHVNSMQGPAHSMASMAVSPLLLSLKLAIAVLVIACPCALGLATPTAILVGSGLGAERGLLIRGGDVLEKAHQLQTIVFDKTGTLTLGHPVVTDCIPLLDTVSPADVLQLAATVERGTQHPLAAAIQQQAQQQALAVLPAQAFHTEAGQGVSAVVADREVVLGTPDWLRQHHITVDESAQAQFHHLATAGKTVIGVGVAGQLAGLIAVQDRLRPDAVETVQRLRQMGLRVLMLTGDQLPVAEAVARPLGLTAEDIVAQVRPDQKAEVIRSLQQGEDSAAKSLPRTVAMVGDGINDAPALAQADVGIALNSGTDVAIESAGIILMHNRLSDVVTALELSRATFKKIQQNLFWALIYNALGIPIAAGLLLPSWGIVLSPAMAGALMAFSSVSVVTNSLLLRRRFQSQLSLN